MIVRETGAPPSILERLLQVERIASLEPLPALGDRSRDIGGARTAPASALPSLLPSLLPSATPPAAERSAAASFLATLPLGQSITARVVAVPVANHVVADIGDLRLTLAWPASSGIAPRPGQDVVLRVLAHRPMLLFQNVADPPEATVDDGEVRWSSDALRLQAIDTTTNASRSSGAVRFDIPILQIDREPLRSAGTPPEDRDASPGSERSEADRNASAFGVERSPDRHVVAPPIERARDIALEDVIVGHTTALVDGVEAPLIPHLQDNGTPTAPPFSPLVLQGPAWDGQPMELVVRRERDDELFDNPVLDHWCGEVTIDLPHLGRVAGHLSFSMQGLRVRIEGDDEHSVMTMSAASSELAAALAHADLRVAGLVVAGRAADATRTDWGVGTDFGYGMRHG